MAKWDDEKMYADSNTYEQIRNELIRNIKTGYDEAGTHKGIWADAHNGDDATGDGSRRKPYKTLGKAVTKSEAVGAYGVIHLASGEYDDNVEMTKSTVISGSGVGTTHLTGNITFSGGVGLLEKCYLIGNVLTMSAMTYVSGCYSLGRVVIDGTEVLCDNFIVSNSIGDGTPAIDILGDATLYHRSSTIIGRGDIPTVRQNGGTMVFDACLITADDTCTFPAVLSTGGVISLRDDAILQQGLLVGGTAVDCSANDATEDNENWITNSKVWGSVTCGAKHTCLHFVRVARVGGMPTGAITGTNKITAGDE